MQERRDCGNGGNRIAGGPRSKMIRAQKGPTVAQIYMTNLQNYNAHSTYVVYALIASCGFWGGPKDSRNSYQRIRGPFAFTKLLNFFSMKQIESIVSAHAKQYLGAH